jgi:hypothetical protein
MFDYEDYFPLAIETVSAWDLPEDEWADAVNAQAKLMAGITLDHTISEPFPSPYTTLQF